GNRGRCALQRRSLQPLDGHARFARGFENHCAFAGSDRGQFDPPRLADALTDSGPLTHWCGGGLHTEAAASKPPCMREETGSGSDCAKPSTRREVASPSHQLGYLDMPTFFRPGGLQFRCFISSLITARQFSLDQAYFILLGQRHPAVGVLGYAMP